MTVVTSKSCIRKASGALVHYFRCDDCLIYEHREAIDSSGEKNSNSHVRFWHLALKFIWIESITDLLCTARRMHIAQAHAVNLRQDFNYYEYY